MVRTSSFVPEREDVVWISIFPQAGHEQAGRRPAVVLSPAAYNGKVGLAIFCPITTQVKGYPFEVSLPEGLEIGGVALSDQLKSLDWKARRAEFICRLPEGVTLEILAKVGALLRFQGGDGMAQGPAAA
jgi:mRNA interferase MazF